VTSQQHASPASTVAASTPGPTPRLSPTAGHEKSLGLERVIFFSDAVFAIVITLLVLPLTAEIELPEGGRDLAQQVWELWPRVLSFVVSFLVIGQFWIAHHHMFTHVRRYDQGLLWFNLVSLLTVTFLPFPTALLGARLETDDAFPVVFYATSMTVSSIALTATWLYAVRGSLIDEAIPARQLHALTLRALATSAIFLLSIAAAFFGLSVAVLVWLLLLPLARTLLVHASTRRNLRAAQTRVRRQTAHGVPTSALTPPAATRTRRSPCDSA
jgi:uncharacterized membrane protein